MSPSAARPLTLVTGGAGFVGTNLAHRLLSDGQRVVILDDLSRPGVERNLRWLTQQHPQDLQVVAASILDKRAVGEAVREASAVYHLAGQVAVTTSLQAPVSDFEVNARGTLNVLEALRALSRPPPMLFTSTNKVYGALDDVALEKRERRYVPVDAGIRGRGVDESRRLDFQSPYGCSKGAADQYVLDYARCFGLRTVVFRMSCIYGPHQCGNEDQGWVAHFVIRALEGRPLTLFGDGCQVRDVLYVEDLVEALQLAIRHSDALSGHAFNIGGGPANTTSLLELLDLLAARQGLEPRVAFYDWRSGDQRYYVSNPERFARATGWRPRTPVERGIGQLCDWLRPGRDAPTQPLRTSSAHRATAIE